MWPVEPRLLRRLPSLLISLALLSPAVTAAQDVRFQVRHGSGGMHRAGFAVGLVVELENTGALDRALQVAVVGDREQWVQSVELPSRTRKQLHLSIASPGVELEFLVELREAGRKLDEVAVPTRVISLEERLIGFVGPRAPGWEALAREDDETWLTYLRAADLPHSPFPLRAFDALVWPDPWTSGASGEQVRAVADWVEQGGRLIVTLGVSRLEATARGLEPLSSLQPSSTVPVTRLDELARLGAATLPLSRPIAVATLDAGKAERRVDESIGTLIALESRGLGRVTVAGFDPTEPALARWPGLPAVWRAMLVWSQPEVVRERRAFGRWDTDPTLLEETDGVLASLLQVAPALPLTLLISAFVLYLVWIGPAEYLVLRRLGRLTWTWITLPAAVLFVTLGSYVAARALEGAGTKASHVLVRDVLPGGATIEELFVAAHRLRGGRFELGPADPDWRPRACGANRVAIDPFLFDEFVEFDLGTASVRQPGFKRASLPACFQRAGRLAESPFSVREWSMQAERLEAVVENRLADEVELYALGRLDDVRLRWATLGTIGPGVHTTRGALVDPLDPPSGAGPWILPEILLMRSAFRAGVDSLETVPSRRVPFRAWSPPYPWEDWSTFLDTGGVVLVARSGDSVVDVDIDGESAPSLGPTLWRVALVPESRR